MAPTQVLCVDDSPDVRAVLQVLIDRTRDLRCVGTLDTAEDLTAQVQRCGADVVVLDLVIPGCDCLEEMRELRRSGSAARIVVFSGNDDEETVRESMEAGAAACVRKAGDPRMLLDSIRRVAPDHGAA